MPPTSRMRSLLACRKRISCAPGVAQERGSLDAGLDRDLAECAAVGFGHGVFLLGVEFEIGSHPLTEEHGVVPFEHPLAGAVPDGA